VMRVVGSLLSVSRVRVPVGLETPEPCAGVLGRVCSVSPCRFTISPH
jgi:hypothetical protein